MATGISTHGTFFISEVLANNVAAHNKSGTFPDVIELHNTGTSAVSLADMSLTDDPLVISKYIFPSGVSLAAEARLAIYADTADTAATRHAPRLRARSDLRARDIQPFIPGQRRYIRLRILSP